jgi:valyl-tRNA synthetase
MHGKFVVHPVDGRRIPLICDAELVDMSFGTGTVKVCVVVTGGACGERRA